MNAEEPDIPEIFRCPKTGQALHFKAGFCGLAPESWSRLSATYELGDPVGYLASQDDESVYPVWRDILGLLSELRASAGSPPAAFLGEEKRSVARFYDEFGWMESTGEEQHFNDALAFEDLRPLTSFYRKRCHRRVNRYLPGGRFLLDVASGPVQIPEYRTFSERYEKRICVDISIKGLLAAKRRLGPHAICVLGDITALPLCDGAIDNFVSLHTIYHVPADEQATAVAELYRILRRGREGIIVYSWGAAAPINRWAERAARWIPAPAPAAIDAPPTTGLGLYFSPHGFDWYRREVASRFPTRLRIWRSVGKEFLQYFVRGRISAAILLWPLYVGEELFPRLLGRIGICPMFVLRKD